MTISFHDQNRKIYYKNGLKHNKTEETCFLLKFNNEIDNGMKNVHQVKSKVHLKNILNYYFTKQK